MKKLIFLLSSIVFAGDFYGYGVIPHIAYGGPYWNTHIIITNKSKTKESLTSMDFFNSNGTPAQLVFIDDIGNNYVANNNLGIRLPPLTSRRLVVTQVPDLLRTGWARFYSVEGDADVFIIYRAKFPASMNRPDYESAIFPEIPYTQEVVFPFDNRFGFITTVAIANTADLMNSFEITIKDPEGNILGQYTQTLFEMCQEAFETAQRWPATANKSGSIYIRANFSSFAMITLLFNPTLSMTSSVPLTVLP